LIEQRLIDMYKEIKDYEGLYQVSDSGMVRSLDRTDSMSRKIQARVLKPWKINSGYLVVGLCKNGKVKRCLVHRLVINAFIKPIPELEHTNHKNGIKTDNRIENLEWSNKSLNGLHAYKTGLSKPLLGSKHPKTTLTEKQVFTIKYQSQNKSRKQLAQQFGVSYDCIRYIQNEKRWAHI